MMLKLISPTGKKVYASHRAAPILVAEHGYAPYGADDPEPGELTLADRVNAIDSHDAANKLADEIGLSGFAAKKPGLAAKKEALLHALAAVGDDDDPEVVNLDDLSDEELAAVVAECYPDHDAETIADAIASKRDEVITDLRSKSAESA